MNWVNIAAINSNENWQFSPIFTESLIRLRHSSNNGLYSRGLIGQIFGDIQQLELYNVKRIYPFYGDDIISVPLLLGENQKVAIKGETQYQPGAFWQINIDVWQGAINLGYEGIAQLESSIENLKDSLVIIDQKINLLLGVTPSFGCENEFTNLHNLGFI